MELELLEKSYFELEYMLITWYKSDNSQLRYHSV